VPKVSVILPTFNRADTIVRAIRSVQAQTLHDWELIVVDDGSTDGTAELIGGMDPRLILIRQTNRGFTEARNAGIRAGKGRYFAFLDSDDEMLPHHLELCAAFLDAHGEELFVATENLEDFGQGRVVNHYRFETSQDYPKKAAIVGSRRLDLPVGETDDYLRVYETREPIGDWGRAIVDRVVADRPPFLYRGRIFDYLRYDFLMTITAAVFRAAVFELLGLPETRWSTGSDFHFLASLCKIARANFISLGTCVKHEFAADGELLACSHVVSGRSSFVEDWQRAWDDLFWHPETQDSELRGLRGLRQIWMAEMALNAGNRGLSLDYLRQARSALPRYRKARTLYWLVLCAPSTSIAQLSYRVLNKVTRGWQWVRAK
jgi:glycosyltransferase involved in cell wall biosynthesis